MAVGGEVVSRTLPVTTPVTDWEGNREEQEHEILALESIYEGQNCFQVLSLAGEDENGSQENTCLQIAVFLQSKYESHHIEAYMTPEDEDTIADSDAGSAKKTLLLRRTVSGKRLIGTCDIRYLTPLTLRISLHPEYPSAAPPTFTLSCLWLSGQQLSSLCQQLDKLWQESLGMPVIFTWVDWLENNTLSFFGMEDVLIMMSPVEEVDPRVVFEYDDLNQSIIGMMRYNRRQQLIEFRKNNQECCVCFDEKPGSCFYILPECQHHVCQECLTLYCQVHVKEGTVHEIICPNSGCDTPVPPCMLKEMLDSEEFMRWEKLILQKSLDRMADIVYCPRCDSPVIKEEEEDLQLAHCTTCFYTFCTECMESSHQGRKCLSLIEKLDKLDSKTANKMGEETFLRIQRQKEMIENEQKSSSFIRTKTRPCPKCRSKIQKNGGCNKVTCSQCLCALCWACGKDITKVSYGHFNDSPKCAEWMVDEPDENLLLVVPQRNEAELQIDATLYVNPDAKKNLIRCPGCKQRNMKTLDDMTITS
ncbi:hypothetical protein ScPMuIL_005835 [Solemya velum]